MSNVATQLMVWLSALSSALGRWLLAPITVMPFWLSVTLVSVVSGVLMLLVFKYTSNQRAIKRVRDDISASLLTLRLFKESAGVAVEAQGRLLSAAARLFALAIVPMAIMALPAWLLIEQLAQWYRYQPLKVGSSAVVVMKVNGDMDDEWPKVSLDPGEDLRVVTGPVHFKKDRWICWDVEACKPGLQRLTFEVDGQKVEKELSAGDTYLPVSVERPSWMWYDVLDNPREPPFGPDSVVQSISINYTARPVWSIFGFFVLEPWMIYWFVISMVAAFCFRRPLGVNF